MPSHASSSNLKELRSRLADSGVRDLQKFASQKGFAELVGCSESLIRNVENNTFPCSARLASAISARTGVCAAWVKGEHEPNIPSSDGSPWKPSDAMALIVSSPRNQAPLGWVIAEAEKRQVPMGRLLAEMTSVMITLSIERNSTGFIEAIARVLREHGMFVGAGTGDAEMGDHEALRRLENAMLAAKSDQRQ